MTPECRTVSCWLHREDDADRADTRAAGVNSQLSRYSSARRGLGGMPRRDRHGLGSLPGQPRSLGSERGLATPSPDREGEIDLGLSQTIMPPDP